MSVLRNSLEFLRGLVLAYKGTKLVSLLLAGVAWYAIRAATSFEAVISDIPLTIQTDPGWTLLDRSARAVDVVFQGARDDIRYLNREQIKVTVDLRGLSAEGGVTARIEARNVNAPGSARVVFIRPSTVSVRMDREAAKQVPVKVDFQNAPPDGYELEKVVCTPATITLAGPLQRLREIESVKTVPVDLEGRIRSFRKTRLALMLGPDGGTLAPDADQVTAEIFIIERSVSAEFEDVPLRLLVQEGAREKAQLSTDKVRLALRGRPEVLKSVEKDTLRVYLDCSDIRTAGDYELPVRVHLPGNIHLVSVDPSVIKVKLRD